MIEKLLTHRQDMLIMKNKLIELVVGEEKPLDNGTNQKIDREFKCPKGMKGFQFEQFKK